MLVAPRNAAANAGNKKVIPELGSAVPVVFLTPIEAPPDTDIAPANADVVTSHLNVPLLGHGQHRVVGGQGLYMKTHTR